MPSLVRRIVLLALAGGVLVDALVPGNAAGVNAPIVMAAFLVAALAVAGREGLRRMDPADAWLVPVALALAAMPAIRADDWLVTVDLLLAAALAVGAIGCLAGGRVTRGLVPRVLELGVGAVAAAGVGAAGVLGRRAPRSSAEPAGRAAVLGARIRRAAPVARGLLIALPVVAVFAALFASADAVFARLASDVLAWQPDIDLADILRRTVVVTIVAWVAAGLLGLGAGLLPAFAAPAREGDPEREGVAGSGAAATVPSSLQPPAAPSPPAAPPAAWSATWPAPAPSEPLRLGAVEATTLLVVVDVLFGVFVGLQLAYLFGGLDTLAMTGLTYAEYARRGFFDLVIVAGLAGALVVTLDLAVARRTRLQLGGSLVLVGLTAVVLVSAFLRLRLYQDAYGWTELRFVVLVAIGWLAVALGIAAGLLVTRRTRWVLHALGILAIVTVAGMNVVGPQAFVAGQNLERAINPALVPPDGRTGLDARYLVELGDEAVAPIVAAWDRLGEPERAALAPVLRDRGVELAEDPALQGWPAWNLTRERARAALLAWEAAQGTASR